MFSRGNKLWLCLAFYVLPLEALSTGPLKAGASDEGVEALHGLERLDSPGGSDGIVSVEPLDAGAGELPVAVLEKQRVVVANGAAAALGVKPGQAAATARTLAEGVSLLERDREAERRCLDELCCWGYGISPTLYPCGEDSLLLEIGSCMRLYGSVEALLARIESQLSFRGYSFCYGLAPTPKAARLFTGPLEVDTNRTPSAVHHHPRRPGSGNSNQEGGPASLPQASGAMTGESLEERLGPLPLRLLEEFPREVDALARAGLWTFGDILALPRKALARRCGKPFVHYLDQVLGVADDIAADFSPPQQFSDTFWFGYEVKANQELLPAIQLLLQSLQNFLRNTQLQCQQLQWDLYGINRKVRQLAVHSSLSQANWQAWYQLTRLKVEQLELDMGIEGIGLVCEQLTPGNADIRDLFQQAGQREPLHSLLDRLKNRLGLQSVHKIACRDEHLPEFAGYSSPDTRPAAPLYTDPEHRPFWLMPEPQRLQEVAGHPCWNGRLTLVDGPERIEDNWWSQAVSRDYYVAKDSGGQQYWIYRDRLREHWYIQGVFH